MKALIAFTKKEFIESLRTYRLAILAAVLLLLGIMSPLFAKIMPALLSGADLGGGIVITAPDPTALDAWSQFFKNVGQMGMLALIITFSGMMANELSRGTLINLLTKGMKRHVVLFSKFLSASVLWTFGYLLCLGVCYGYTEYFWPAGILHNVLLAFMSPWLFGEFLIALLLLGGTLFGNLYGSLSTCLGAVIVLSLLNIAPAVQAYNPISLAGGTFSLLNAEKEAVDFIPAVVICAAATLLLIVMSVIVFHKKRI